MIKIYGNCDSDGEIERQFVTDDLKKYRYILSLLRKYGYDIHYYDDNNPCDLIANHKYHTIKITVKLRNEV